MVFLGVRQDYEGGCWVGDQDWGESLDLKELLVGGLEAGSERMQ